MTRSEVIYEEVYGWLVSLPAEVAGIAAKKVEAVWFIGGALLCTQHGVQQTVAGVLRCQVHAGPGFLTS